MSSDTLSSLECTVHRRDNCLFVIFKYFFVFLLKKKKKKTIFVYLIQPKQQRGYSMCAYSEVHVYIVSVFVIL